MTVFLFEKLKVRDVYDNSIDIQNYQTSAEFFIDRLVIIKEKLVRDTNYTEKYER